MKPLRHGIGGLMDKQTALEAWRQMYKEIDKDNWLYVGTINPEMVSIAIEAIEKELEHD